MFEEARPLARSDFEEAAKLLRDELEGIWSEGKELPKRFPLIKQVRAEYNLGLKDAVDLIAMMEEMYPSDLGEMGYFG